MNKWVSISAVLGALAVIMGAFGAHGLQGRVEEKAIEWVRTGAHYQLTHALALLGWALWRQHSGQESTIPGWGFLVGTLIFSGTLYAMTLGAPRWFGAITPIGGSLLIGAWLVFAWQALNSSP